MALLFAREIVQRVDDDISDLRPLSPDLLETPNLIYEMMTGNLFEHEYGFD